jgi:hypothetical protein
MPGLDPEIWSQGMKITASCTYPNTPCLTINVVNNILTEIDIVLNYKITVEEAIKYLGNPDYIGADRASGELIACRVYSVWSGKQLVIVSRIFEGVQEEEENCGLVWVSGKILSSTLLSEVRYVSVAYIEKNQPSTGGLFVEFKGTIPEK